MKSKKLVVAVGLFSIALLGANMKAEAAFVADVNTKAVIKFVEDTEGEIVDPNMPWEVIVPPENQGGGTKGSLRLTYVPDFQFGEVMIKSGVQTVNPYVEKFTEKFGTPQARERYIPQFIQVEDMRPDEKQWKVSVKASKFESQSTSQAKHILQDTQLVFTGKTMTNNIYDNANTLLTNGIGSEFKVTESNQIIFATAAGKNTKGSISSLILNDQGKVEPEKADNRNQGVYLEKGAKDVPNLDTYKATLTWTLDDTL